MKVIKLWLLGKDIGTVKDIFVSNLRMTENHKN